MSSVPDYDIIEDFVAESSECLEMAIDDVLCLEQGMDQEAINRIFRVVHTLKGTAGMLNFNGLFNFIHALEDTCSDIRSGNRIVDKTMADNLLRCFDYIQSKLDVIKVERQEGDDFSLGEECMNVLRGTPQGNANTGDELLSLVLDGNVCKTLIVEDDFAARKRLFSHLSQFSTCYVAKDGSEAIQAVTESYLEASPEPFNLIVINAKLPIIDGLQAARAIRALERAKGVQSSAMAKIFVTTSREDSRQRHTALHECGADAFIDEPIDPCDLTRLFVHRLPLAESNDMMHFQ